MRKPLEWEDLEETEGCRDVEGRGRIGGDWEEVRE